MADTSSPATSKGVKLAGEVDQAKKEMILYEWWFRIQLDPLTGISEMRS